MTKENRLIKALAQGGPLNDRDLLLEHVVATISGLQVGSELQSTLTASFLNIFWTDLNHPPSNSLADEYVDSSFSLIFKLIPP